MSWPCECGKRMKCLETRMREGSTYRRYKCDCGTRITTSEQSVDAVVSSRNQFFNPENFERWKAGMMSKLADSIGFLEKAGKP